MAVRLLRYFLIFFVLIMVFLLTKNPYSLKYNSAGSNLPEIELFDVKSFEITVKKISSIIYATKVERYRKYDKMFDIRALYKDKLNLTDTVVAQNGMLSNNILYLDNNVKYTRSDDLSLSSNSLKYDLKNKILSSNVPFKFVKKNVTTNGKSFVYYMQKGIIKANKIKTIIILDK